MKTKFRLMVSVKATTKSNDELANKYKDKTGSYKNQKQTSNSMENKSETKAICEGKILSEKKKKRTTEKDAQEKVDCRHSNLKERNIVQRIQAVVERYKETDIKNPNNRLSPKKKEKGDSEPMDSKCGIKERILFRGFIEEMELFGIEFRVIEL